MPLWGEYVLGIKGPFGPVSPVISCHSSVPALYSRDDWYTNFHYNVRKTDKGKNYAF